MTIAIFQIIISVLLAGLILLQERGSAMSGLLGGDSGGFYQTRRGIEKILFGATIVGVIAFVALAVLQLVIK